MTTTNPVPAPGVKRHHTQRDPHTSALYLHELLKAIEFIADTAQPGDRAPGLAGLVTIAAERAEDLVADLEDYTAPA